MTQLRDPRPVHAPGQLLTVLTVVLAVVLGAPQVWDEVRAGRPGLASVFFPVLAVALGLLAVSRRAR